MIKIIKEINKRELKEFLYNIDLSDNNLYEELNEGRALSVFQFSGDTAENLVTRIKPKNFNEMCAVNALARPGTIDFADDYIDSKDKNVNKYPKLVQEVLKDSYGVCLFQESIMSIFNKIGGFTLEETNCLFKDTLITTSEGQTTGIEECQARTARIQRNHIFCCMTAFLALEAKRITEGTSWYESKYSIVKDAIKFYLKSPTISLNFA